LSQIGNLVKIGHNYEILSKLRKLVTISLFNQNWEIDQNLVEIGKLVTIRKFTNLIW